jgi:hypothetical protein
VKEQTTEKWALMTPGGDFLAWSSAATLAREFAPAVYHTPIPSEAATWGSKDHAERTRNERNLQGHAAVLLPEDIL